ncbi:MAG: M57 family metalloprotease [Chitinophagaceae bacterium]
MRTALYKFIVALLVAGQFFCACHKQAKVVTAEEIPINVLERIAAAGFSTAGVLKRDNGYVVEGDILLSAEQLEQGVPTGKEIVYAKEEHYRTTNLVTGTPRTISISLSAASPAYFNNPLNIAINRFNELNLVLTFARVTSNANIQVSTFYDPNDIAVYGGGPTSNGNPYPTIRFNTYWYPITVNTNYLASIIAHEIGHCIGFRHTDYMNRSFSCGGSAVNEGTAGVGAIWVPGTPTGGSANSWMLACSSGSDRPFTTADQTALTTVY